MSLSLFLCLCLHFCLSVIQSLSLCLSVSVPLCPSVSLYLSLSLYVSLFRSSLSLSYFISFLKNRRTEFTTRVSTYHRVHWGVQAESNRLRCWAHRQGSAIGATAELGLLIVFAAGRGRESEKWLGNQMGLWFQISVFETYIKKAKDRGRNRGKEVTAVENVCVCVCVCLCVCEFVWWEFVHKLNNAMNNCVVFRGYELGSCCVSSYTLSPLQLVFSSCLLFFWTITVDGSNSSSLSATEVGLFLLFLFVLRPSPRNSWSNIWKCEKKKKSNFCRGHLRLFRRHRSWQNLWPRGWQWRRSMSQR